MHLFQLACAMICFQLWICVPVVWAQRDLKNIPDPDPELERQTFILANGLEVSLFAADPALAKPIQINFDERGRLWIASSEVYPHIKPGEVANDKILVLEDTDQDGRADKTTIFADGLLIPTGVIPGDGGAYVVNSTELLHLRDTDGDGKADQRRVVLSGFGTEDTHHLLHTLRWGQDGCLYMNQSIYIHSHVETPYGVKRLNGGGIWRFRPETMHLEVLCYGFVNPWGHHTDAWGQSFATDGAYHEGINYVFPGSVFVTAPGAKRIVAGLNPGSPKHCGLEIISGSHFPPDWTGSMITSDFRAHRVCRFVVRDDGAGYAARQEVEVIKSSHVAFRPIDAKVGPRGELFIADWYNPIIQHGEVDFRDPRRDHVHGRIWRVTAKGRPLVQVPNYEMASDSELLAWLKLPEDWVRLNAKLHLKRRSLANPDSMARIVRTTREWIAKLDAGSPSFEHDRLEGLWVFQNIGQVEPMLLDQLLKSPDHRVRAAAMRVASEWRHELPSAFESFRKGVADEHPRVRLEAVRALALVGTLDAASAAMNVQSRPLDPFLDFALWQTMRDLEPHWLPAVRERRLDFGGNTDYLLFALQAVESPAVVSPLLDLIQRHSLSPQRSGDVLSLIAKLGGASELGAVLNSVLDATSRLSPETRAALLRAMAETARNRKIQPAGDLTRIESLFGTNHEPLRAAALRAAGSWNLDTLRGKIEAIAQDGTATAAVRGAAIDAVGALGGEASVAILARLAASDDALTIRSEALNALVTVEPRRAAQHAVDLLGHQPPLADPAPLLAGLLAQRGGPQLLAAALEGKSLAPDVAKLAVRTVQTSSQPSAELIEALRKAGQLTATGLTWTPEVSQQLVAEVTTTGNAARGEKIYRRAELQCTKCHAIAGAGGRVGPDLISIGATAPVDYLVESMLAPNAKIKENYHSKLIATADGRVISGIPVRESLTELVVRDAEDREITIPVASIEERKDGRSLMPDGASDQLTRSELVDLLRFLSELGKVGDFAVGNAQVVRRWELLLWTQVAHQRLNRTSHDTAATDDPTLTWQSAYSKVLGELPLDGLPRFQPHKETEPTSFVRCQLDVTTPGVVRMQLNATDGLSFWLDGKPSPVSDTLKLDLSRGPHTLTFDINHNKRQRGLRLELLDSPAEVKLVSGK